MWRCSTAVFKDPFGCIVLSMLKSRTLIELINTQKTIMTSNVPPPLIPETPEVLRSFRLCLWGTKPMECIDRLEERPR